MIKKIKTFSLVLLVLIISGCGDATIRDCKRAGFNGMIVHKSLNEPFGNNIYCSNNIRNSKGSFLIGNTTKSNIKYTYFEFPKGDS